MGLLACTSLGRRFVPLVTLALLVGACSGSAPAAGKRPPAPQPAPAGVPSGAAPSSASAPAPQTRQRLRISYGATIGVHVPIYAANRLGEWESQGLDVEVQRIA